MTPGGTRRWSGSTGSVTTRVDVVSAAGEYAVRGGILDVFPATADTPVRIEFFGDDVESIRPFELQSQRSSGSLDAITIAPWIEILRDERLRENVARARRRRVQRRSRRCARIWAADTTSPNRGSASPTTNVRRSSTTSIPTR